MGRLVRWFRVLAWRHAEGLFWWQYRADHMEFDTLFVEGKKGEGKTRYLTGYACGLMRRGVRVCSNYSITDRLTGAKSVPVTGWLDVLRLSVEALREGIPTMFVIDEFHLWCDSRAWQKTPEWFRGWLAQARHYGVGVCGTVQNFTTVELRARQLADKLLRVRKLHLGRVPLYRSEEVAPESVESEGGYDLSSASLHFFKWYAGYSTRELIQVELWRSDAEIDAEVERLTSEAAALVKPAEFSSFADYERARSADASGGERALRVDEPADWMDYETLSLS